jgi:hypothetical protein
MRERRGELGQALLDYRAMLEAGGADSLLMPHIAYLSKLLDRDQQMSFLPIVGDLKIAETVPLWAARSDAADPKPVSTGFEIPGGLSLFARSIGVNPLAAAEPRAAEALFSYFLEAAPDPQNDSVEYNPVRRDALLYLKQYGALERFLEKERLLPASGVGEIVISLTGRAADSERAKRALSFFGISYRLIFNGQKPAFLFTFKPGGAARDRQRLLRNMGVILTDGSTDVIRIPWKKETLPLLLGAEFWEKTLGPGQKGRTLLQCFVQDPAPMRLYIGLARCSRAAREALAASVPADQLLKTADALLVYGPALEFRGSGLWLPGSLSGWEHAYGEKSSDLAHFIPALGTHSGRGFALYSALAASPESVQHYFTSVPERLLSLDDMLMAYDSGRLLGVSYLLAKQDLGRIFRSIGEGLRWMGMPQPADGNYTPILEKLLDRPDVTRPYRIYSPADTLDLIWYIGHTRPAILNPDVLRLIMQDTQQSPIFLDLVWDVDPEPGLLAKYLEFCYQLGAAQTREWNVDRTRASQSLFFLLSAFRREGILSKEQGNILLASSLEVLNAPDELQSAAGISEYLCRDLLPAAGADCRDSSVTDPLLNALAGAKGKADTNGTFGSDIGNLRYDRMQAAVARQRYVPLKQLLDFYHELAEVRNGKATASRIVLQWNSIREKIAPGKEWEEVAGERKSEIARQISVLSSASDPAVIRSAAETIASGLNTELGISLLAECYAYSGAAETDALQFDPDFIRKHRFFRERATEPSGWTVTGIGHEDKTGTFLQGSLSGLRYELSVLSWTKDVQRFSTGEGNGLVSAILFGLQSVPQRLRSDRAQEYVALSCLLGRELLAFYGVNPEIHRWLDSLLQILVPPRRREEATDLLNRFAVGDGAAVLTPSELFLIGEQYLASRKLVLVPSRGIPESDAPEFHSPALEHLIATLPQKSSEDASRFREEIEQYGVSLRRRVGLEQSSFLLLDPYERLETNAPEEILNERVCDLKIRLAELNYAAGVPAGTVELEAPLAVRDILPQRPHTPVSNWSFAIERINALRPERVQAWVSESFSRSQSAAAEKSGSAPAR